MAQPVEIGPSAWCCSDSPDISVVRIHPADVYVSWQAVEDHISRALETTDKLGMDDALTMCAEGEAQLWVGFDFKAEESVIGACITAIETFSDDYRVITTLALGGNDFRRWDQLLLGAVEEFGRENGCDVIEIQGRKGWGKWFQGFTETSRYFVKEL